MSLKTNKLKKKSMKLAINLANKRIGLTGNNPSVGCVIEKNDQIISTGQTGYGGTPHAEIDAINNSIESVSGSNMYISLEPCSHYGKTPPCTKKIIKSKIKNVFYAFTDIDTRSSNKAEKILKKRGINVKKNFMLSDAKSLYKSYKVIKNTLYPYITAKIACTKNYQIKSKTKYITNEHSLNISHLLRYKNQGILTSYKTINDDNPLLNCRLNGLENFSPTKLILDKNLKIKIKSNVINYRLKSKVFIFYNKKNSKFKKLKKRGIKLLYAPLDKNNNLDINYVLKKIKSLGINYLLLEFGKKLTYYFIENKLINEFFLFKSNKNVKKTNNIGIFDIKKKLNITFKKKSAINTYLQNDNIIKYY